MKTKPSKIFLTPDTGTVPKLFQVPIEKASFDYFQGDLLIGVGGGERVG